jgi:outer membrane protein assembly factor BamB
MVFRRVFAGLALCAAALVLCVPVSAFAEVTPVTGAADNLRTGWYPDEASLVPSSVTAANFGQAFKAQLKGAIMAQPLIANGTLLVVTEEDMAYGLDPLTGAVRWERKFGAPLKAEQIACPDVSPYVGITGTPVIDTEDDVAYFVSNSYLKGETGETGWYMQAVNLASGEEVSGFPVQLSGMEAQNVHGVKLLGNKQLQRPALLLLEGVVYAAFGSHCDYAPYYGMIAGVSTGGALKAMWAPSTTEGSIWQSGGGLISDGPKQILFTTSNGTPEGEGSPGKAAGTAPPEGSLSESVVRVEVQPDGQLKATEFFSPFNNKELDEIDLDFGSAAPIALPSKYFGTPTDPDLLVQASKTGEIYLLNRDELGGMGQGAGGTDKVIEEKGLGQYGGVWDGAAVWPGDGGYIYIPGVSTPDSGSENFDYLRYFKYEVENGLPKISEAAKSSEQFGFGSGSPIVTSNGTTSGSAVLWITHCPYTEPLHCGEGERTELWAYDAVPVAGKPQRLWKAPIGFGSKFSRPLANGGHIYVGNHEGQVFAFSGPALTPSSDSLEYGTVPLGNPQTQELTFKNTGTALKVTAVHTSGAPFETTGLPAVGTAIEPGQEITVKVKFNPTAAGTFSGSLSLTTQAGETSVNLSGSASEPTPMPSPLSPLGGSQTIAGALPPSPISGILGTHASRPALSHLSLRFLASKSSRHAREAKITYTLTAADKVKLVVYRRITSHRCKRGTHTCFSYLTTKIGGTVTGEAGTNQLVLDIAPLPAGNYRLDATPVASSDATAGTRYLPFTVSR